MEIDITIITNLFITGFFGLLFLLFLYQTHKKQREAPFFNFSLLCGFLGGVFATIDSVRQYLGNIDHTLLLVIQISCYCLQFFGFYLFLESITGLKVNPIRLSIIISLLVVALGSWEFSFTPLLKKGKNIRSW